MAELYSGWLKAQPVDKVVSDCLGDHWRKIDSGMWQSVSTNQIISSVILSSLAPLKEVV